MTDKPTIFIGSDHAGFELKAHLMHRFPEYEWHDEGTFSEESVDYPDFAEKVAVRMKENPQSFGVLICGSGEGMAIKANRYVWIRAALCWSEEVAQLSRRHNNANVLCLAARLVERSLNEKIFSAFFAASFEGGRHQRRVAKL